MNNILFSVVIPTFNRESLIRQTLESVAGQLGQGFEVIVVDDGSSDGTCQIVEEFRSVRLIRQQNAGPGAARNRGVREATGTYIAFLDSDDLWFPWTLEILKQVVTTANEPAFVAGCPSVFCSEQELTNVREHPLQFEQFEDYLQSGNEWRWFGVSSFLIRRDVFLRSGGFREGLVNGEDAELALRLGCEQGFVQIQSPPTFGYRSHSGNVTANFSRTMEAALHLVQQEKSQRFPGGTQRASDRHRIISRHVRPVSLQCLSEGLFAEAWSFYRQMFWWNLRLCKAKYLLGFPVAVLWKSMFSGPTDHDKSV